MIVVREIEVKASARKELREERYKLMLFWYFPNVEFKESLDCISMPIFRYLIDLNH